MVAQRLAVEPEQDKAEQAKVLPEEADRVLESSDLMAHPMTCDKLAPETAPSAEALAREAAVAVAESVVVADAQAAVALVAVVDHEFKSSNSELKSSSRWTKRGTLLSC